MSVDIQKCYDNVNQARMQEIINDIVHDDQYLIQPPLSPSSLPQPRATSMEAGENRWRLAGARNVSRTVSQALPSVHRFGVLKRYGIYYHQQTRYHVSIKGAPAE